MLVFFSTGASGASPAPLLSQFGSSSGRGRLVVAVVCFGHNFDPIDAQRPAGAVLEAPKTRQGGLEGGLEPFWRRPGSVRTASGASWGTSGASWQRPGHVLRPFARDNTRTRGAKSTKTQRPSGMRGPPLGHFNWSNQPFSASCSPWREWGRIDNACGASPATPL